MKCSLASLQVSFREHCKQCEDDGGVGEGVGGEGGESTTELGKFRGMRERTKPN